MDQKRKCIEEYFNTLSNKLINENGTKHQSSGLDIVLFGGGALYLHGARARFVDLDFFIPPSSVKASELKHLQNNTTWNPLEIDLTCERDLFADFSFGPIETYSKILTENTVSGTHCRLRVLPIEALIIQKMYMPREKEVADATNLSKLTSPQKIVNMFNTLAESNSEDTMESIASQVISEVAIHYFSESTQNYNNGVSCLINSMHLGEESKEALRESYGLHDQEHKEQTHMWPSSKKKPKETHLDSDGPGF